MRSREAATPEDAKDTASPPPAPPLAAPLPTTLPPRTLDSEAPLPHELAAVPPPWDGAPAPTTTLPAPLPSPWPPPPFGGQRSSVRLR